MPLLLKNSPAGQPKHTALPSTGIVHTRSVTVLERARGTAIAHHIDIDVGGGGGLGTRSVLKTRGPRRATQQRIAHSIRDQGGIGRGANHHIPTAALNP